MKVKDLVCELHLPKKLEKTIINGQEKENNLPNGKLVKTYPVDLYPSCPKNWILGSDKESSYFVGVKENDGMWLNFNKCYEHSHDVAIVISIQGVNPITGLKTDKLRLEKYKKNCPVHDVPFQSENFCPKCQFKWPYQNYLSTTGTPEGSLWLDGFRCSDGRVRQYVFTTEVMKGIASQIIGNDRVYAIGIAFYLSKSTKEKKSQSDNHFDNRIDVKNDISIYHVTEHKDMNCRIVDSRFDRTVYQDVYHTTCSGDFLGELCSFRYGPQNIGYASCSNQMNLFTGGLSYLQSKEQGLFDEDMYDEDDDYDICIGSSCNNDIERVVEKTKLEIAAGSLIRQKIHADPKDITYWEEEPYGIIYLNYTDIQTFENILKNGAIPEKTDGFLTNLKKI